MLFVTFLMKMFVIYEYFPSIKFINIPTAFVS